jgi:hypothetical protein
VVALITFTAMVGMLLATPGDGAVADPAVWIDWASR